MSGLFGEPMKAVYDLEESNKTDNVFKTDILYIPWVGVQSIKDLQVNKKESFIDRIHYLSNKL